ncbi:protein trachealess-like isoform X2 [Saccostrea echinata]|uniref:protein trachealess-like isoform X2 n=1 Tax=Saccostrea echinata TaxID=191078 RepID=UPI002A7EF516|nr:protein trachealess-like isoform X2 [Saccostrea echinata]
MLVSKGTRLAMEGAVIFTNCFQYSEMDYEAFGSILELRKEKSRDAARSRRGKENYEFYELAKLLPLPAAITSQLDKASIIRLSISYLKLREFSGLGDPPWNRDHFSANKSLKGSGRRRNVSNIAMDIFDSHQGTHILQSVDGFAFILANDGRFLYVSETVSIYLGLSQVEMTGSSIFDYVHVQDHQELLEQLGLATPNWTIPDVPSPSSQSDTGSAPSTPRATTPPSPDQTNFMAPNPNKGLKRTFCLRMKSTLTKRGVHIRTSGYRVVYITGHLRPRPCFGANRKVSSNILGMVGMAVALPPPTITELRIESDTFIMRLNPDFSIIYCDTLISELSEWSSDDVIGKPIYDLCHPGDLQKMRRAHKDLITKGQVLSDYIRLINKNGGYVWSQMCASTLYSSKTSDVHTVLTIIYILSGVEHGNCVMDISQLPTSVKTELDQTSSNKDPNITGDQLQDHGENKHTTSPGSDQMDMYPPPESPDNPPRKKRPSSNGSEMDDLQDSPRINCQSPPVFVSHDDETSQSSNSASPLKINSNKVLFKNSRRKMEKPRKRHRGSLDSDNLVFPESYGQEISNSSDSLQRRLSCTNLLQDNNNVSPPVNGYHSHSESPKCLEDYNVPAPEDLSLRSLNTRQDSMTTNTQRKNCWHSPGAVDQNGNRNMSSVKFLEDVMNKHLPNLSQLTNHDIKPSSAIMSDIITSNIVSNSQNRQQSPNQWGGSETETHPASSLLRTLHAKRESVIRSSSNTRTFPMESSAINMLTPPSNDGYKEQLTLNIPQISVSAKGSVLPSYSSASHLTVSTTTESFNMTPPSSVSPTEKLISPFGIEGNFDHGSSACSSLTHVTSPTVTLKSQTFPFTVSSTGTDFNCVKTTGYNNISPAYHTNEYPHLSHSQNSFLSYDVRPDTWYPVSFQS